MRLKQLQVWFEAAEPAAIENKRRGK